MDNSHVKKRDRARQVLTETAPDGLVVSTQALLEFFSVATLKLRDKLSPDEAAAGVAWMSGLHVVPTDAQIVNTAIDLTLDHSISIWDAMMVRAAQAGGCDRLLTEDLSHGESFGPVRIENPFR